MISRISVNSHIIRANRKHGTNDPPIRVSQGSTVTYAREVEFGEGYRLVYRPNQPLSCGAVVYFETEQAVEVVA